MNHNLENIDQMITDDPDLIAPIMHMCGEHLDKFRKDAKKQNDALLREALGDACHLLGMKKRPPKKTFASLCTRIVRAIFPNGITSQHHQGEKKFYATIEPFI